MQSHMCQWHIPDQSIQFKNKSIKLQNYSPEIITVQPLGVTDQATSTEQVPTQTLTIMLAGMHNQDGGTTWD